MLKNRKTKATLINSYKSDTKPLTHNLYKLPSPIEYLSGSYTEYVIVSRSYVESKKGWEVLIFPSNSSGEHLGWIELYEESGWHRSDDILNRYMEKSYA
jgi:hypothetical protein